MFRHAVVGWLDAEPRFEVVGQAGSSPQTLSALRETEADAVVLDLSLEGADGLELIKHLRTEHRDLRILVLSMHDEKVYAMRALRAGAHGYIMKRAPGEAFVEALDQVLAGKIYVSPAFGNTLIYRSVHSAETGDDSPLARLSDRELEVLRHVGEGRSSRAIAELLRLSIKTVESHRLRLRDKLGVENSAELVRFATEFVSEPSLD